jgi:hypothetical protein
VCDQRQKRTAKRSAFAGVLTLTKEIVMIGRITRIALFASVAVLVSALFASSGAHPAAKAQPPKNPHMNSDRHCKSVGGTILTNFGAVDQYTTLGPATGDLGGAVAATLTQPPASGQGGTVIFHIQHHWVTTSGDNILFDPAIATTQPISSTLFAVITYKATINGGTGKFAGATGELNIIGEADTVNGTAFRYSGEACFTDAD